MVSSLKPMLSKLDTPDFRNLMSVATPQLDWDRAIRLKKIVYMFMGSMIVKETAYAIGMLALQDLLNFIGRLELIIFRSLTLWHAAPALFTILIVGFLEGSWARANQKALVKMHSP